MNAVSDAGNPTQSVHLSHITLYNTLSLYSNTISFQ